MTSHLHQRVQIALRIGVLLTSALVAVPLASAQPGDSPPVVEYLWIDANEGGAAGGHVALRIDDVVHHFHLETGGLLRLYREDVAGFERLYTHRRNRTIRAARLDVGRETRDLLRAGFEGYFAEQEAAAARVSTAREDATWLERLAEIAVAREHAAAHTEPGAPGIALDGLGFFFEDGAAPLRPGPETETRSIREVARRVVTRAGASVLDAHARDLHAQIAGLDSAPDPRPGRAAEVHARSLARRHGDRLEMLAALDVLRIAPSLRKDAARDADAPELALSDEDRPALETERERWIERATNAAIRAEAGEGFAVLVALARLCAIDRSLASGRLVVLDAFAAQHDLLSREDLAADDAHTESLRSEAYAAFVAARKAVRASSATRARSTSAEELASGPWARLEGAINRWLELEETLAGRRSLRVNSGPLLPSRRAVRSDFALPAASPERLRAAAERLRFDSDANARRFRADYDYDLLTRNCVTEIFRIIDASLIGRTSRVLTDDERARAAQQAKTRLGGFVDAGSGFHFVPHRAFAAVLAHWKVGSTRELPALRRQRLADLERAGASTAGERSVLTSSIYQANDDDSLFLFFTDDAFAARPLYGLANLLVGFGGSLAGLLSTPFDGGRLLDRATRGIVFSLPELAFSNIRKGSFETLAADDAVLGLATPVGATPNGVAGEGS